MALDYFIVDAFRHGPFTGNPAAVLLVNNSPSDAWMQAVAGETNLSATCFVWPKTAGNDSSWRLRWFTPRCEVVLCGHGTLAAAHILWQLGLVQDQRINFDAGPQHFPLRCHACPSSRDLGEPAQNHHSPSEISLDFPANRAEPDEITTALQDVLPPAITAVGRSITIPGTLLIQLPEAEAVTHFTPDFAAMRAATRECLLLTAPSNQDGFDIVSRFFPLHAGFNEDPVTGSAHCMLAPWWQPRLQRQGLRCYQASSRGGTVDVSWDGKQTVTLTGRASTLLRGQWQSLMKAITT